MPQPIDLPLAQARRLALVSQQLPRSSFRRGLNGTRDAIEHMGYVQIDTISVVQRSHHHTLWNRVPHYRPRYVDKLVSNRSIFEYWSHAAAYLPMRDFRFCLPRMRALSGGRRLWYERDPKLMREILARIRAEGPLQAKDFESHATTGMWEWGPVKQAIENLFMEGKVLVTRRENFQKLFDLTERVIPPGVDVTEPTSSQYAHHLIERYLNAHGIGRMPEFGYQRPDTGAALKQAVQEKQEAGEILPVQVRGLSGLHYVGVDFERPLSKPLARSLVRILSPFDNLIIQRKRIQQLFDYDYQLECYVPAQKRKHGYFCLPILWQGRLVARMDAKADRPRQCLIVRYLQTEAHVKRIEAFAERLSEELCRFMTFNQCRTIELDAVSPPLLKRMLKKYLDASMG